MEFLKTKYCYKHWAKRLLALVFDFAGAVVTFPIRFFAKKIDPKNISRILCIRLDHLGDVLMVRPAVQALRRRYPQAQIDVLIAAKIAPLFQDDPSFRVISSDLDWYSSPSSCGKQWAEFMRLLPALKGYHYDLGIDFRGDIRNIFLMAWVGIPHRLSYGITGGGFLLTDKIPFDEKLHQVELNFKLLEPLGIPLDPANLPLGYTEAQKKDFFDRCGFPWSNKKQCLVIHPSAGYPSKKWPGVKYKQLIEKILKARLASLIIIGTQKDKQDFPLDFQDSGDFIDLRGKTNMTDLPILFDHVEGYVGNDSGPAHLAAAQGLPLLVLFSGTNDSRVWHPWTNRIKLVTHSVPCSPCEARECPLKHHDCMEKISVEEVFAEVEKIIK